MGSIFTSDCTLDAEITHKLAAATQGSCCKCAFQQLRQANVYSSRALTLSIQMQFFPCIVMSVLLYSGEAWAALKQHMYISAVAVPDELLAMHLWHILT